MTVTDAVEDRVKSSDPSNGSVVNGDPNKADSGEEEGVKQAFLALPSENTSSPQKSSILQVFKKVPLFFHQKLSQPVVCSGGYNSVFIIIFISLSLSLDLGYGVLCDVCVHGYSVSFSRGYGGCENGVWREMGYETHTCSFIYNVIIMTANSLTNPR